MLKEIFQFNPCLRVHLEAGTLIRLVFFFFFFPPLVFGGLVNNLSTSWNVAKKIIFITNLEDMKSISSLYPSSNILQKVVYLCS